VRRAGLLTVLEIVPRDLYALHVDLPSRDLSPIRYVDGQAVLTIEIGYLRPYPNRLRAELTRQSGRSL
jgi:hypothetical protein